jgi:hypothetical protein
VLKLRVKEISKYRRETTFTNEKCGHENVFDYNTPFICKTSFCTESLPKVDKLYGRENQLNRLKYYTGKEI